MPTAAPDLRARPPSPSPLQLRWLPCLALATLCGAALPACEGPPRSLARPNAVALGPAGEVYVSDFHHQRIVVFDQQGRYGGEFGRQGLGVDQLWRVWGLAVRPDGSLLAVQERPVAHDDQTVVWEFKVFDKRRQRAVYPLVGEQWKGEQWVEGLTALPDGGWLVCEQERSEMLRFSAEGALLGPWGKGDAALPLQEPCPAAGGGAGRPGAAAAGPSPRGGGGRRRLGL